MTSLVLRPKVNTKISPNDWMYKANPDPVAYLEAGWSVGRALAAASLIADLNPRRILDFGCGHGRVLRWIRALYPEAEISAADRVRNGVDYCSETFDSRPIYTTDCFDELLVGDNYDLIWLGSVYTHLPMDLWIKLTNKLIETLSPQGILSFSFAGPHVAGLIERGERNLHAEANEDGVKTLLSDYNYTGFGYARHEVNNEREWGRSVISHQRLFSFLSQNNLSVVMLGERLYADRQDIVAARLAAD